MSIEIIESTEHKRVHCCTCIRVFISRGSVAKKTEIVDGEEKITILHYCSQECLDNLLQSEE